MLRRDNGVYWYLVGEMGSPRCCVARGEMRLSQRSKTSLDYTSSTRERLYVLCRLAQSYKDTQHGMSCATRRVGHYYRYEQGSWYINCGHYGQI